MVPCEEHLRHDLSGLYTCSCGARPTGSAKDAQHPLPLAGLYAVEKACPLTSNLSGLAFLISSPPKFPLTDTAIHHHYSGFTNAALGVPLPAKNAVIMAYPQRNLISKALQEQLPAPCSANVSFRYRNPLHPH